MTLHHGRDQQMANDSARRRTATAGSAGFEGRTLADMRPYLCLRQPGVPILGAFMLPAHLQDGRATGLRCVGVFTTKMPTDADYRGRGAPGGHASTSQRRMEEGRDTLRMDPLELPGAELDQATQEFPFTPWPADLRLEARRARPTARAKELFD